MDAHISLFKPQTSSKGLEKRSELRITHNTSSEIDFGTGAYLLIFKQGGSRLTSGIAYVNITPYIEGSFIDKIAGGTIFMTDTINLSVSDVNKITINNQDAGDLPVTVYAFV